MSAIGELDPSPCDAFVRAVEHQWTALMGRGLFLSGHDTALVERWHHDGLPLDVVMEGLRTALEQRREKSGVRALPMRLSAYSQGVEAARERLLEHTPGRVVAAPVPTPKPTDESGSATDESGALAALARLERSAQAASLRQAARDVAASGELDPFEVDERLLDALWAALEPEELARLEGELAARLLLEPPMGPRGRELRRRAFLRQALERDYGLVRVAGGDL